MTLRQEEQNRSSEIWTVSGVGSATGSVLIVGGRYREKSGCLMNNGHWILEAADTIDDRFRLVPENQTLPICWESNRVAFDATFEYSPNNTMGHDKK